jgi:hypothetical protein
VVESFGPGSDGEGVEQPFAQLADLATALTHASVDPARFIAARSKQVWPGEVTV